MNIAFGPVPSRRLGRSLGINNIPPKICTYSCVYCQLGRTIKMQDNRQEFYTPEQVVSSVRDKVSRARNSGESIDYLTFVPDGEPTLDLNLADEILGLGDLGIPVAVISNASLIWRQDVRDALMGADWVSLKIDAVNMPAWRRVNRPHGKLELPEILKGVREFADAFEGEFVTETMLVSGVNDEVVTLREIAEFLDEIQPSVAYIAIPTRPPAEAWAHPAPEDRIHQAYQFFCEHVDRVELLLGYEGNAFASTGDPEQDLLSITAVHPMRRDAVEQLLAKTDTNWRLVEELVKKEKLVELSHNGRNYYLRRIAEPYIRQDA
jgi:wyosine [tRNA(Phe)-imidazoG37] synthetase (radical SAM superfamily)